MTKKVGLIVNPIAGMGGAVGLKGTDGKDILKRAIALGAKPMAPEKAEMFLSKLKAELRATIQLITGAGQMGEDEATNRGFSPIVIGIGKGKTSADDTRRVAKVIKAKDADLLVFCGGDGTARDIFDVVGTNLAVLGVPTGVKMHSAVFAVDPQSAARVVVKFLCEKFPLKESEVMDVREEAYRKGELATELYGYMLTPYEPSLVQGAKIASPITETERDNQAAIAKNIVEEMKPDTVYIIGPGTTMRPIMEILGEEKSLLGIDIIQNKKLIAKDVNEKQILEKIKDKKAKIIVTPIGGQGFIFGRGNLQISSTVIRQVSKNNIIVAATRHKIRSLRNLRVDTGDAELDDTLRGYISVKTGYREETAVRVN